MFQFLWFLRVKGFFFGEFAREAIIYFAALPGNKLNILHFGIFVRFSSVLDQWKCYLLKSQIGCEKEVLHTRYFWNCAIALLEISRKIVNNTRKSLDVVIVGKVFNSGQLISC